MATALAVPVLGIAVLLQTTILARIPLLEGPADLVLLVLLSWSLHEQVRNAWQWALIAGLLLGWMSAIPPWVPVIAYLLATGAAWLLRRQVWQIPILALFSAAIAGTLLTHGTVYAVLRIEGRPLDLVQAFNLVTLPSLLLNLLLAIPVNGAVSELASWLYPPELET